MSIVGVEINNRIIFQEVVTDSNLHTQIITDIENHIANYVKKKYNACCYGNGTYINKTETYIITGRDNVDLTRILNSIGTCEQISKTLNLYKLTTDKSVEEIASLCGVVKIQKESTVELV